MDTVRMHCVYPGPTMENELGEALRMPLPLHKIKTRLPCKGSQRQAKDRAFFNAPYAKDKQTKGRLPRIRSQGQAKNGAFFNAPSDRLNHGSLSCVRDDRYGKDRWDDKF